MAAGVAGKWTAEVPGRGGNLQNVTFDFKADGETLSGTVTSPRGEVPIEDGKISGDDLSFSATLKFNDNEVKILYKGKVDADGTIHFTRERAGGDGNKAEFVAKKAG